MKKFLVLLASLSSLCATSQITDINELAIKLANIQPYSQNASFEVLLPSAEDPVTYDIVLESISQPNDSLAPCDYIITWHTISPAGPLDGFSAYFSGNHYRLRNDKLLEYHFDANPLAFNPLGTQDGIRAGVQQTAQFADMLPQFLALKMAQMSSDSSYSYTFHPDTLISGKRRIAVDGVKRHAGYDIARFTYIFDKESGLPIAAELENSPGSISEQIVTLSYSESQSKAPADITEEMLMQRWPDEFEKFRESTFRVENLAGRPLPPFSSQVLGQSERFTRHVGDAFDSNVIIVAIDPAVSSTPATIQAVRNAVQMLPTAYTVIWAFNSNNDSEISSVIAPVMANEIALKSASDLLRKAGITLYPTIIIADKSAIVKDVIPGYNKDLEEIVIQKTML